MVSLNYLNEMILYIELDKSIAATHQHASTHDDYRLSRQHRPVRPVCTQRVSKTRLCLILGIRKRRTATWKSRIL